jgi:hypothetical protein
MLFSASISENPSVLVEVPVPKLPRLGNPFVVRLFVVEVEPPVTEEALVAEFVVVEDGDGPFVVEVEIVGVEDALDDEPDVVGDEDAALSESRELFERGSRVREQPERARPEHAVAVEDECVVIDQQRSLLLGGVENREGETVFVADPALRLNPPQR